MFSFFANANIPHQVCFYAERVVCNTSTDTYLGDSTESLTIVICMKIDHGGICWRSRALQHDFSFHLSFFCLWFRCFFFQTGFQVQHTIRMILWAFYRSFPFFAVQVQHTIRTILWAFYRSFTSFLRFLSRLSYLFRFCGVDARFRLIDERLIKNTICRIW